MTPHTADPVDLRKAMDTALTAVRAGCAELARGRRKLAHIRTALKSPGDITTEIDRAAEEAILTHIRAVYPSHAVIGEESGASGDSPCRWIVDPLDGTMNYVHGIAYYAVSVALKAHGDIVLGIVADPARKELFSAVRGQGAYCNGKRLAVANRQSLDEAVIGTVVPPPRWPGMDDYLGMFCRVAKGAGAMRRMGAAALDLAYVAAGRLDGFFVVSLKSWDIAAGSLLVQEAGGAVADVDGAGDPLRSNRLAAANPALLPQLLRALSPPCDQRSCTR